jgi:hypothetical protein
MDKFNYELIYPSLSDAVRSILQIDLKISFGENKDFIVYPRSVYKSVKDVESDDDEEYITRL